MLMKYHFLFVCVRLSLSNFLFLFLFSIWLTSFLFWMNCSDCLLSLLNASLKWIQFAFDCEKNHANNNNNFYIVHQTSGTFKAANENMKLFGFVFFGISRWIVLIEYSPVALLAIKPLILINNNEQNINYTHQAVIHLINIFTIYDLCVQAKHLILDTPYNCYDRR